MSDVEFRNWDTAKFKRQLLDIVERNCEPTGTFLQRSSRARLYAITEPAWGHEYRRLVARLINFEIERRPNEIVLNFGVQKTRDSRYHGLYIELGSREAPAHPFLRPAVFGNQKRIARILTAGIGEP